jgi:hypothetical protein
MPFSFGNQIRLPALAIMRSPVGTTDLRMGLHGAMKPGN